MNGDDDQLRDFLKGMKTVRWTVGIVGGGMLVLASYVFVASLIERLKAGDSLDWPIVQGRVVSSQVVVASASVLVVISLLS
jgi:hypothetical protein